eukprot:TRINITY_DN4685_c0_g1_i3.p1 TRINITY_DN4685_c0_g1~~TRINITY_DN4685_c0_g1_i3.p1  ORF type:complete len:792 (+),score=171.13 TRINITY_DN4685_c0_g1_i3:47-2422(+)
MSDSKMDTDKQPEPEKKKMEDKSEEAKASHHAEKIRKLKKYKEQQREKMKGKGIYVTNLGILSRSNVQAYFTKFGTITNIHVIWDKSNKDKLNSMLIDFEMEESVLQILSKKHRYNHLILCGPNNEKMQRVKVMERKVRESRPRSPSPPPPSQISFGEIKARLSVHTDLDEQIQEIMYLTELGEDDIEERNAICGNISKTFAKNGHPRCVVSPFGSTVNGLGFRGCDVDIFLDLGEDENFEKKLTQVQKVRLAASLLRYIPHCCRIHPITGARVPIVKFIHRSTGINCDISFKNRASVLNSEYIRYCTEQDDRIRPLMMAIRLVCKRYEVAGGGGGCKISNYALTMLIILYLQELEKPLLHPLHTLQQCFDGEPELIDGWNFSFCSDFTKLPQLPVNRQGLFDLFSGFFCFYSSLDLRTKFLSPFLGKALDRTILEKELPPEYKDKPEFINHDSFGMDRCIQLQDPFELSFNVCKNLPERGYRTIMTLFGQVHNKCEELKECLRPGGFNQLLELDIKPEENADLPELKDMFGEKNKVYLAFILPSITKLTMDSCLASISQEETDKSNVKTDDPNMETTPVADDASDEIKEKVPEHTQEASEQAKDAESVVNISADLQKMNQLLCYIFSDCLKFKQVNVPEIPIPVNIQDLKSDGCLKRKPEIELHSSEGKRARHESTEDSSQDSDKDGFVLTADWEVRLHVWAGRKRYHAQVYDTDQDSSVLQKEAEITVNQLKSAPPLDDIPTEVSFRHHIKISQGRTVLGLEMLRSRKKSFENLFTWLRSYIPDLMKRL